MGAPNDLEKGAAAVPEPQKPAAFNTGGPAAYNSGAPAYPPMVQGYPQAGGHMQQPGGYAQQPGGYAAQPPPQGHPGYTPGHNVPYNSVQAAHSYDSCCACFNIQWILFIFGFWWAVPSIIAVFLPIFQRNRLQTDPSYRGGWICNIVLSVLWVIGAIITAVLVSRAQRSGQYSNVNYNYG